MERDHEDGTSSVIQGAILEDDGFVTIVVESYRPGSMSVTPGSIMLVPE
jgi:hypothetical protein